MHDPEILTARLRLSRLVLADAPAVFSYRADSDVSRYTVFAPETLQEVEGFIRSLECNAFDLPGSWFQFAIRLQESGQLAGDLGTHCSEDGRQVEIGFTLSPAFQKLGYGTEAVKGMLDYLFKTLGKHRVTASVDPGNSASQALLARAGFRQEAHFRQSLWFKGEWTDDMVFAILKSEWIAS